MLKKTGSGEGKAKVTFVLARLANADHVHVAGDFNGWQATTPMKRQKDGSWRATVELEPGREYQFRYLVDGNVWVNDEAADAYVPNPFGADNCVVRTPEASATAGKTSRGRGRGGSSPATGTHASGGGRGSGSTGKAAGGKPTGKGAGGKPTGKGAGGKPTGSGAGRGPGRNNGKGTGRARAGRARPSEPPHGD